MPLTDIQKVQIRKYTGYGAVGNIANPTWGFRYFGNWGMLEFVMTNMSEDEVNEVVNNFLPKLTQLESDIYGVRDNSDTSAAAVWARNPKEFDERKKNYRHWRLSLCEFLTIVPGIGLRSGSVIVNGGY